MHRRLRATSSLLRGQMSDWLHSPRTVIMGLAILGLTYIYAMDYIEILETYDLTSHAGEALFVYLSKGFGNITLTSALFLIMVSEIPRRIPFQNDMLIRSSRVRWLRSQFLFCFSVVALMIVLMIVFSMVLTMPSLPLGNGWSMRLELDPDAPWIPSYVPEFIRVIPPWQASILAAAILFAFWFTMVLVILLCSLAERPHLGLILYVFILVLHVTLMWEFLPPFLRVMPINFSTLASVASLYPDKELESIPIVLMVYAALDLCLMGIMRFQVRVMEMRFTAKENA